jgi:hypothetical protein
MLYDINLRMWFRAFYLPYKHSCNMEILAEKAEILVFKGKNPCEVEYV